MSGVVPALAQDEEESEGRKKSFRSPCCLRPNCRPPPSKPTLDSLRQLTAGGNNGQSAGDGVPAASDAMVLQSDVEKVLDQDPNCRPCKPRWPKGDRLHFKLASGQLGASSTRRNWPTKTF